MLFLQQGVDQCVQTWVSIGQAHLNNSKDLLVFRIKARDFLFQAQLSLLLSH